MSSIQLDKEFDENGFDLIGWHKLHRAAKKDDVKSVKHLIEHGVSVDFRTTNSKRTPLMIAALEGCLNAARCLIEMKANIDARDTNGRTPLLLAADEERPEIVKLLLHAKADKSCVTTKGFWSGSTALDIMKIMDADLFKEAITMLEAEPAPIAPIAPFPALR